MVGQPDRKAKIDSPGNVGFPFCDEWQRQTTAALVLVWGWRMKIDELKVHDLAMNLPNERMSREEQEVNVNLGRFQYDKDFTERHLAGGPLTFLEAKRVAREQLTFDHWLVTFYEMVQFPQARYFKTEAEAMEYFRKATEEREGLRPQRMEVSGPKDAIFQARKTKIEWKAEGYTPDPMTFKYR